MRIPHVISVVGSVLILGCGGALQYPRSFDDALLPGAIVVIFSKPPKIEIVCRQEDSVGTVTLLDPKADKAPVPNPSGEPTVETKAVPNPDAVIVSKTPQPDFTSTSKTESKVTLDAGVSKVLSVLKAEGKKVSKISYSAKNVTGYTISLADEWKGRQKRHKACIATVDKQQKEWQLALVTKAFTGDITYSVEFEAGLSAEAKLEITKEIAPSLGGTSDTATTTSVVGSGVTWIAQSMPYANDSASGD